MLAPLARRIALARPVATAFQTRPFSATSPNNDNNQGTVSKLDNTPAKELSDFKRFTPADIFSEFTDAAGRAELNKIRDAEDELIQTVTTEVEPIDWEQWRKEIQFPGLVDELKQMHDDTPMPDVEEEKRKLEQQVEDTFNPILDELQKMAAEAEAKAEEYEKKAEEVSYMHDNLREMTVDEFLEKYPSVKEAIAKDVEENRWFIEE